MVQIVPGGEDCSSVQTLGGVCTVLEAQKPAAFILENVDMESKGKKADDSQPLDSKGWLYIFSGIFWTYVGTSGNMGGWMDGWMDEWMAGLHMPLLPHRLVFKAPRLATLRKQQ